MNESRDKTEYIGKKEKFEEMMNKLVTIAKEDGVITEKEAEILNKIRIPLDQFKIAVDKSVEDGIITDKEYLSLKNIEDNLLQKVFNLIEYDDKLDSDSKKLVTSIFDVMMSTL